MTNVVAINLTKRAGLTVVSNALRQGAQLIVGFVVTPVVIRGLGAELYGAWQMIEQAIQYLARSDLRPAGTLRIFLTVRQHDSDDKEKKRLVGAALLITVAMIPLVLVVGMGLVWSTPFFIRVAPQYEWAVRVTMAIAVLRIVLDKLLGLPASILSGMNLEYKAMGSNAVTLLMGGAFSVVAIKAGWGLPGVAVAAVIGVILNGGVRFYVARKHVPWLGVLRPERAELVHFSRSSSWFFTSSLADAFLNVSDLLIAGIILGPAAAGMYAATGAVLRMVIAPVSQMLSSASSGIGDMCGRKEWERVTSIRNEMLVLTAITMTIVGAGVLSLNKAFMGLWIGDGFFCGDVVNLLLVVIAYLKVLLRTESLLLDSLLVFREKSMAFLVCGITTLGAGVALTHWFGAVGMAASVLAGHVCLLICCRRLIAMKLVTQRFERPPLKLAGVSLIVLCLAYVVPSFFYPEKITSFALAAAAVGFLAFGTIWTLGLGKGGKALILSRFATILKR